jgi:hypothetical protein
MSGANEANLSSVLGASLLRRLPRRLDGRGLRRPRERVRARDREPDGRRRLPVRGRGRSLARRVRVRAPRGVFGLRENHEASRRRDVLLHHRLRDHDLPRGHRVPGRPRRSQDPAGRRRVRPLAHRRHRRLGHPPVVRLLAPGGGPRGSRARILRAQGPGSRLRVHRRFRHLDHDGRERGVPPRRHSRHRLAGGISTRTSTPSGRRPHGKSDGRSPTSRARPTGSRSPSLSSLPFPSPSSADRSS